MIKFLCILYVAFPSSGGYDVYQFEKEFPSIEECQAWKHQQEFLPDPMGQTTLYRSCEKVWEI